MSTTIQSQVSLVQAESGIALGSAVQRTSTEDGFILYSSELTTVFQTLQFGDVVNARNIFIKLISGDSVLVSVDNGATFPLLLSGAGDPMLLGMDSRSTSSITCVADVEGSLGGKYFIIHDLDGPVWVWLDTGNGNGVAASGSILYGVPEDSDTVIVNGTTLTKVASGPVGNEFTTIAELEALIEAIININASQDGTIVSISASAIGTEGNAYTLALGTNTGTMTISGGTLTGGINSSIAPIATTQRLLPVAIASGDTASVVADKVAAALNADDSFLCPNPAAATLSITDTKAGTRTTITAGTSTFTNPSTVFTPAAVVKVKSQSNSQIVVAIAPA